MKKIIIATLIVIIGLVVCIFNPSMSSEPDDEATEDIDTLANVKNYRRAYDRGFEDGMKKFIDTHIVEGPCIINEDLEAKNIAIIRIIELKAEPLLTVKGEHIKVKNCNMSMYKTLR
jgi:hypothetical protein